MGGYEPKTEHLQGGWRRAGWRSGGVAETRLPSGVVTILRNNFIPNASECNKQTRFATASFEVIKGTYMRHKDHVDVYAPRWRPRFATAATLRDGGHASRRHHATRWHHASRWQRFATVRGGRRRVGGVRVSGGPVGGGRVGEGRAGGGRGGGDGGLKPIGSLR